MGEVTQNPFVPKLTNSNLPRYHRSRKAPSSVIIAGLDYVLERFQASDVGRRIPVVSMSLSCSPSDALDHAVQSLIDHGVHVVVCADSFHDV
jgi:hypothetical protein